MYVLLLTHSSSYNLAQEVSGHFCSAALPWAVSTIISRFISWRLLLLAHISYAGSHIALALPPLHCMFATCSFTYLSDLWHFKHGCTYYLSCLHLEMWMGFCSIHRQHRYSYEYYAQDQKESSDATQYKHTLTDFHHGRVRFTHSHLPQLGNSTYGITSSSDLSLQPPREVNFG